MDVSRILVFGDSYSNNGNLTITHPDVQWPVYVAQAFGISMQPRFPLIDGTGNPASTMYAVDSTSAYGLNGDFTSPYTVTRQVQKAIVDNGTFLPTDVLVIWTGQNDIYKDGYGQFILSVPMVQVLPLMDRNVGLIIGSAQQAVAAGAKNILFINAAPITTTPLIFTNTAQSPPVGQIQAYYRNALQRACVFNKFPMYDPLPDWYERFNNPQKYGIGNTSSFYPASPVFGVDFRDQYFFRDNFHPGPTIQRMLATGVVKAIAGMTGFQGVAEDALNSIKATAQLS